MLKKIVLATSALVLLIACIQENIGDNTTEVSAVTIGADEITEVSAVLKGKATLGSSAASGLKAGFQYSTSADILPSNSATVEASDVDANYNYSAKVTGLEPHTTYYFRSIVRLDNVDAYGETMSFKTGEEGVFFGPVDLGLPSGLKWATCNIGASKPEEYGDYYAWGETETKSDYDSYKWCDGSWTKLTKYNTNTSYGNADNKAILENSDDVAHLKFGGKWRMPTDAEWTELRTKCSWTWTTQNGVKGRKVTGPNGNSIFLPATGSRYKTDLVNAGSYGYYWSASLNTDAPNHAWYVYFNSGEVHRSDSYRNYGFTVRPVYGDAVSVTGVSLNMTSLTMNVGETETLVATVKPDNAADKSVTWSSSNTSVATVSNTGVVAAIKAGSATITARTNDGGKTATCSVTVKAGFFADANGNPIKVTFTQNWWGEVHSAYIKYYEEDGIRHCETYGEEGDLSGAQTPGPGFWGNGDYHLSFIWNAKTNYIDIPEQTIGWEYDAGYWVKIYDRYNYYNVLNSTYAGSWPTADDFYNQNSDQLEYRSYYDGNGGFYLYVEWYYMINLGGWHVETFDMVGIGEGFNRTNYQVTGVSLNTTSLTMNEGETKTLVATVKPDNADDKHVTWSSSNTSVATVSSSGVVTAKKAGNATITVKTNNGGKTATCAVTVKGASGQQAVDLGLPSGLKWGSCNIGASKPEEYGDYYAWGETETKSKYDWSTYKWRNGSYNPLTKYNTSSSYGTVDNKTKLENSDDVARVKFGGKWRMPTDAEWTELRTKCSWTWTTQNGVKGRKVTGPNGKSIFLPAAGSRYGTSLDYAGSLGYYWSSSLGAGSLGPQGAWSVDFGSEVVYRSDFVRFLGFSVRPVSE